MRKEEFFKNIGFSEDEKQNYYKYYEIAGKTADACARRFMRENADYNAVLEELHTSHCDINEYTLDLIFLFSCTDYLYEDYQKNNISDDVFFDTMCDIPCKMRECIKVNHIFGVNCVGWFERIFRLKKFGMGRLQFDMITDYGIGLNFGDYEITPDTFIVSCHIPSGGSLSLDAVMASFGRAYEFFKDKLTDGILPIFCESWFFYPDYQKVFLKCTPNIAKFSSLFKVFGTIKHETFRDAWRVFGCDYNGEISVLPQNTRLQKGFVDHIKSGKTFGVGKGVLFFDGEKIL